MSETIKLSEVEKIKTDSNYLRGTIAESLENEITGALATDDVQLIKFHGSYQQTDRDLDSERKKQKLEPLYSFMIRVRMPGGIANPQQWLVMDELAKRYGSNTLKLTTRQAFQLHGILKRNLKKTMQEINKSLFDTIAACGDVNRNVMACPNPFVSAAHKEVYEHVDQISLHLLPKTKAYHEIWLNNKPLSISEPDEEPIYGKTYLPRKFKIAIAVPPYNDVDVFANDLGFIAITEKGQLIGYNVVVGGGMGTTFGNEATFPRLADLIGYIPKDKIIEVSEQVVKIQRDNGNRSDRKFSRMKYTIERMGLGTFKKELNQRLGWELSPARDYNFESNNDRYGWYKSDNARWNLCLYIEAGRVKDTENLKLKSALREVALISDGSFILTGNQNLIIANLSVKKKKETDAILEKYGISIGENLSGLRANSLACVALNTCTLAFAEAERYLPDLLGKIESLLDKSGIADVPINIRMTGCPNGCARPFLGEIALVGRAPGKYNLYLGASHTGDRLNRLHKEMLGEKEILETLEPLFVSFAKERLENERFGDFLVRKKVVEITTKPEGFHKV